LISRNTERFRSVQGLDDAPIDRLHGSSLVVFDRVRDTLAKRSSDGFVRRCHGDLHLANITLIEDHPVLFDAIEFDPAMATTDVLYDLAFPVMDLLHFARRDAANIVLNRYLSGSEDANHDGLAALPLFLSIRAAIRANVMFTQAERGSEASTFDRAKKYFTLAADLIEPRPPRLVAIGGTSGTGKSVLARALATRIEPAPGAVILRSDVIRKRIFGVAETTPLPAEAYQANVSGQVYDNLVTTAAQILAQGISVIADAAYLRESERDAIRRAALKQGAAFDGLFLYAGLATRLARITARRNDASDANVEVAKLQEHFDIGALKDWTTLDASGSPEQTCAAGVAALVLR
jgi:predicted kinase